MHVEQDVLVQSAPVTYSVVVEDGPVDAEHTYPYQGRNEASTFRARISTTMALIMAMLGSSVIPVSYAFATTGITCGLLISLVVALCNTYTCQLFLSAAGATRTSTFEELAAAVGGKPLMRLAQLSNIILLFGNLTGDFCLLADLGSQSLKSSLGHDAPWILVSNHGRGTMLLLVAGVIFPLSLFRGMRALESVSTAGMSVILLLFGVLTYNAFASGFHGIASGEVPLWSLGGASGADIANAFALLGFSFYLHPLMMPMLAEMPPGPRGVRILSDSVTFVIMVVAFVTISFVGAMGAATFGANTKGDIMMNQLLPPGLPSLAFALAMLLYLSSCIPPIVLSLRCYLDFIIAGPRAGFRLPRFLALTVGIVLVPMALAWSNPSLSERAFALTGASGVCIVCYIIPVVVHLILLFRRKTPPPAPAGSATQNGSSGSMPSSAAARWLQEEEALGQSGMDDPAVPLLPAAKQYLPTPETLWGWAGHAGVPVMVLIIGCGLSGLSLYSSLHSEPEA
eukprot:jgi/Ulvmu1/10013/UM059_0062.1